MYRIECRDVKNAGAVYYRYTRHQVADLVRRFLAHGRATIGDKIIEIRIVSQRHSARERPF
jgi:hypothetical protein